MTVEEMLRQELEDVATGLEIPRLPELATPAVRRSWVPAMLTAAAVLLLLLAAAGVLHVSRSTEPAPSGPTHTPSQTPSGSAAIIPTDMPSVEPGALVRPKPTVNGKPLPAYPAGSNVWVSWNPVAWTAHSGIPPSGPEYWGLGTTMHELPTDKLGGAAVSPDGTRIAYARSAGGDVQLVVVDTESARETAQVTVPGPVGVAAVTDAGVVVFGRLAYDASCSYSACREGMRVWDSSSGRITDLPHVGRLVEQTPDGVVLEGFDFHRPWLVEFDARGRGHRVTRLPDRYVTVDPSNTWAVVVVHNWKHHNYHIETSHLGLWNVSSGRRVALLDLPGPYQFDMGDPCCNLRWESTDLFVVPIWREADPVRQVARCSLRLERCILLRRSAP